MGFYPCNNNNYVKEIMNLYGYRSMSLIDSDGNLTTKDIYNASTRQYVPYDSEYLRCTTIILGSTYQGHIYALKAGTYYAGDGNSQQGGKVVLTSSDVFPYDLTAATITYGGNWAVVWAVAI